MLGKGRSIFKHFLECRIIPMMPVLFLYFITVPHAYAHKVYLFAWIEGEMVHTDSYFPNKKKVIGGLVRVFDSSGRKLVEGKTDEGGAFSFKIPKKTDLRIVLEATMGHKTEYLLPADEVPEVTTTSEQTNGRIKLKKDQSSAPVQVNVELIRIMVEKALDSRLKPISKTLAEMQEEKGPGFTEIIGGIGYIFGIMGLILYFINRKKVDP